MTAARSFQTLNKLRDLSYANNDVDTLVADRVGQGTIPNVVLDYFGDYMIEDNAHLEGKGIWLMIV